MSAFNDELALWLTKSLHAGISSVHTADGFGGAYHKRRESTFFTTLNVILNYENVPTTIAEVVHIRLSELLLVVKMMKLSHDYAFTICSVRSLLDFTEKAIQDHLDAPAPVSKGFGSSFDATKFTFGGANETKTDSFSGFGSDSKWIATTDTDERDAKRKRTRI